MKKLYYVLFIVGLYCFSEAFHEYMVINGALKAAAVGFLIAFACKLMFKVVTRTIVFIAILAGALYFLISTGYIELPSELSELLSGILMYIHS